MKRIVFIDLVRAFAILSMVQGHLISGVLSEAYTGSGSTLYSYWNFNRGLTAPVFFFISGLIFTFLLFKNSNRENNTRVTKGIKRALTLIGAGYILQFNVSFVTELAQLNILKYQTMFMSHVLHSIGFGLFLIIGLYYITDKLKIPFWFLALLFANAIFLMRPFAEEMSWIHYLPLPIATYFNKDFSSIFPLVPWLGFVSWGALAGYLFFKFPSLIHSKFTPFVLTTFAVLFKIYRYEIFNSIYLITKSDTIKSIINYDFTYYHLPNVLIVISIFMLISNLFKKIPYTIQKIGQNTFYIYIIHVLILYGTTFYPGIVPRYKRMLGPWESIVLAVIVEALIVLMVIYKEKLSDILGNLYLLIRNNLMQSYKFYFKKNSF
jgi:uncharacterized membrane protein